MIRPCCGVLAGCLVLSSCVPWTVRPIAQKDSDSSQGRPFDAAAYVDSIWNSKVLPTVSGRAVDLAEFLAACRSDSAAAARRFGPCLLVKGEGKVLRMDTSSLTGLMMVDLSPYDGRADAAIQIGPVIRGTVLRDALPFIQFSQFVNQLEFAGVGNLLNLRVAKTVVASLPKEGLAGSVVSFSGAAAQPLENGVVEIVPVTIAVRRGKP